MKIRFSVKIPMTIVFGCMFAILSAFSVAAEDAIKKQYLPIDSDGDGVLDEQDECYKTPAGTRVNVRGCKDNSLTFETINLKINFDFDSAVVNTEYFPEVKKVADFMMKYPLTRVILEAHTDSDGSAQYNQLLSQRRAQSVARVLVTRFRIKPARITATGFGESQPLVENNSVENKSKNRRVVAVLKALVQN